MKMAVSYSNRLKIVGKGIVSYGRQKVLLCGNGLKNGIRCCCRLCCWDLPFPKQVLVSTCLKNKFFENTGVKEEIACNEQFLLFPQCFLPLLENFLFSSFENCLQFLWVWNSPKFVIWERVKDHETRVQSQLVFVKSASCERDLVITTSLWGIRVMVSVRTTARIFMDGFQINLAQLLSSMRCAFWRFHSVRSKVRVMQDQQVVPRQPCS